MNSTHTNSTPHIHEIITNTPRRINGYRSRKLFKWKMRNITVTILVAIVVNQTHATSLQPLLETNQPPYTLINFALEEDTKIDQTTEIQKKETNKRRTRINTQLNRRRQWIDSQFDQLKRKQMANRTGFIGK